MTIFSRFYYSITRFVEKHERCIYVLNFFLWLLLVIFVSMKHEVWRDEVRALSIALEPESIWELPSSLKNEGHPILWYLILRIGYDITHTPAILKIASMTIAFSSIVLFCKYAPFPLWQKLLFCWGALPLYEYSVMARNYGISMLLLFLFAICYPQRQKKPYILSIILIALANSNMHSCMLAALLLLFWFLDDFVQHYRSLNRQVITSFLFGFFFTCIGIAIAIATTIPTQDTAVTGVFSLEISHIVQAVGINLQHPSVTFRELFQGEIIHQDFFDSELLLGDVLLWMLVIGLVISPYTSIVAFLGMIMFGTFFIVIYPGFLRHQGLLLLFILSLYWMIYPRVTDLPYSKIKRYLLICYKVSMYGTFSILFIFHIVFAWRFIKKDITGDMSSSKIFGEFIHSHPEYHDAILMSEPDHFIESWPYYLSNSIYLPREERFGKRVLFTKVGKQRMSLGEILDSAIQIKNQAQRPVLIAINSQWSLSSSRQTETECYYVHHKVFGWTNEELSRFETNTVKIADFDAAVGDENYEIYRVSE